VLIEQIEIRGERVGLTIQVKVYGPVPTGKLRNTMIISGNLRRRAGNIVLGNEGITSNG
jgi:hypothetical protein